MAMAMAMKKEKEKGKKLELELEMVTHHQFHHFHQKSTAVASNSYFHSEDHQLMYHQNTSIFQMMDQKRDRGDKYT